MNRSSFLKTIAGAAAVVAAPFAGEASVALAANDTLSEHSVRVQPLVWERIGEYNWKACIKTRTDLVTVATIYYKDDLHHPYRVYLGDQAACIEDYCPTLDDAMHVAAIRWKHLVNAVVL